MRDCMSMFIVQVIIQMNVSDPKPGSSFMQYLAFTIDNTVLYTVKWLQVTKFKIIFKF